MKNLVFFYPKIDDDGLKRTFILYLKFFSKKYNIVVITSSPNLKVPKELLSKITVDSIENSILEKISFINNFLCLCKIFKYLNKKTVFFSLDKHSYLLVLKFFKINLKLILRIPNPIMTKKISGNKIFSNYAGNFIGNLDLSLSRYADKVIIYSKKNFNFVKKKYKLKNLILIRNFFEKKGKIKDKKIKKSYNIFFIGRLEINKDPYFFLKSLIKIKNLNFNIHIVGEGSEKKKLKKLKNMYDKINIKIYGHIHNPFEKLYKDMDLFCLTSRFDGTPNVLGEAISYKIPCIAPKSVGSVDELLGNGKFGNIYKPENEKSFINAVRSALKNYRESIRKANLAYINLELFNKKNTLDRLNKNIANLTY